MIQRQIKLKLTRSQQRELERWFIHLAAVWNWAIRKIELDAADGFYYSERALRDLLKGHSRKIGVPSHVMRGVITDAYAAWQRCYAKIAGKPKLKGRRNKITSIPFPDPFTTPTQGRMLVLGLRRVVFHKQSLPAGEIKCGRIVKRVSGWYLCLFIDAEPNAVPTTGKGCVGIDPGFTNLLTLSTGEKIEHPRELNQSALRLAQSQRGGNKRLTARISERVANQRKDRNHKLSRQIVSENQFIAFSADRHRSIAKRFGKSVSDSAHYQLRRMLSYKSKRRTDGLGVYVEVESRNSTRTCSDCGAVSGPQGWAGLKVREWDCGACGAHHDRDVNAAMNALISGAGLAHERLAKVA